MLRLNYHHLFIFWILSREGTFSRCALRLRISQSAVTSQVKQLEELLGLTLIDRQNKRKPTITEEGRLVAEFAGVIFEKGEELLSWSKTGIQGQARILRVGAISSLSRNFQYEFLEPILSRADAKIEVTTGDQEKLIRLLKEHALDVILSSHNVVSDGKTKFYSHVLQTSDLVFVIHRKNRLRESNIKDYLKKFSLVLPGPNFEARPEVDAFIERLKIQAKILAEIDDIALMRLFALRSGAIVALPEMGVQNELKSKELIVIGRASGVGQRFYAITRDKKYPNLFVEELVRATKK